MDPRGSWTRYADFYRASSYSAFPQEHRDSPGRLPFQMFMVEQAGHDFVDASVPEIVLSMALRVEQGNEYAWDMGSGWHREISVPGRIVLLPPENESRWKVKGDRQILVLAIPSRTFRQILGSVAPDRLSEAFMPLSDQTWEDNLIQPMLLRLWGATAGGHPTDRLLVDSGLVTVVSHLAQRLEVSHHPIKFVALAPWRLKRVVDYVDAHLHEPLDLLSLADVAGLSVRHFARAFREELGETPHRWLLARRLDRATQLLKRNDMPIARIAEACGFAGQSHFTKVFKELTGESPKRWFHQHNSSN